MGFPFLKSLHRKYDLPGRRRSHAAAAASRLSQLLSSAGVAQSPLLGDHTQPALLLCPLGSFYRKKSKESASQCGQSVIKQ